MVGADNKAAAWGQMWSAVHGLKPWLVCNSFKIPWCYWLSLVVVLLLPMGLLPLLLWWRWPLQLLMALRPRNWLLCKLPRRNGLT